MQMYGKWSNTEQLTGKDQLEWPTHAEDAEVKLLVKTSFLRKGNLRGTRTKQPLLVDRWTADLGVCMQISMDSERLSYNMKK